ncbi:hypothetical protein C2E23DRAFT_810970 [Lenzites betulinus]|nr:hypothetical protein C2E23DRAFT_810970 [Lenzites betulinus]
MASCILAITNVLLIHERCSSRATRQHLQDGSSRSSDEDDGWEEWTCALAYDKQHYLCTWCPKCLAIHVARLIPHMNTGALLRHI